MKAYAYYGPYVANWKSKDWILGTIKGQQNQDFTHLGPGRRDKWENIPLWQALYLYGGRTELLNQLSTTITYAWDAGSGGVLSNNNSSLLIVYRGAVKAKLKEKQIIVITTVLISGVAYQVAQATANPGNQGVYVMSGSRILVDDVKDLITQLLAQ